MLQAHKPISLWTWMTLDLNRFYFSHRFELRIEFLQFLSDNWKKRGTVDVFGGIQSLQFWLPSHNTNWWIEFSAFFHSSKPIWNKLIENSYRTFVVSLAHWTKIAVRILSSAPSAMMRLQLALTISDVGVWVCITNCISLTIAAAFKWLFFCKIIMEIDFIYKF